MALKKLLPLFFSIYTNILLGQTRAEASLIYNNASYDIYVIRIDTSSLKRFQFVENTSGTAHKGFIAQNGLFGKNTFCIKACINDSSCSPLGLMVKDGNETHPLNLKDGTENFYLKPNGVFAVSERRAFITEASKFLLQKNIRLAVQSGPMLVVDNYLHPVFKADSKNKTFRSGVGVYQENGAEYIVFAISNTRVTFYDFAMLFWQKFHCKNALSLESAGCVMEIPFISRTNPADGSVICNYLVFEE